MLRAGLDTGYCLLRRAPLGPAPAVVSLVKRTAPSRSPQPSKGSTMLAKLKSVLRRVWRWRSAITGRYVSRTYAEAHPETTTRERVR